MDANEVWEVLDALDLRVVRYWVAGGWGVDALLGSETRLHRDLDLAVDATHLGLCSEALAGLEYVVETDALPLRIEFAADSDRWVDVHPVTFDPGGHGLQGEPRGIHFLYPPQAFSTGRISRRLVRCLSAKQQLLFHTGYELRPQDHHDLRILTTLADPQA